MAIDMATVFRKSYTDPLPVNAEIHIRNGERPHLTVRAKLDSPEHVLVGNFTLSPATVPEPSDFAIWSLLCGIVLAVGQRRRKRKAA